MGDGQTFAEALRDKVNQSRLDVIEDNIRDLEKMMDAIDGAAATLWIRFKVLERRVDDLELRRT